ncbi:MAG TPA: hypothetical protein V6C78_19440 [Crinalium sp.]|jgi:hypothetical protein
MNTKFTKEIRANFDRKHITGIALGVFAINALTFGLIRPAYSATTSNGNLNCTTQVNNTAATATCSGTGVWRLRIDCAAEADYVSEWVGQGGGAVQKRGECTFKARNATVEFQ